MHDPISLTYERKANIIIFGRVLASAILVGLLTILLVARLCYLQIVQHDYQTAVSDRNRIHLRAITPRRGLIYDRKGVALASNRTQFNLVFTREHAPDSRAVMNRLRELLKLSPEQTDSIAKRLARVGRRFESVTLLDDLNEEQIALLAVNEFLLPGVEVQVQFSRQYPKGAQFAHVVGYVGRITEQESKKLDAGEYRGTQVIGKSGIEQSYEVALHGHVGFEEVETDAQGRVLRVIRRQEPVPGEDVVLSLDSALQELAEQALGDRRGAVVALDPDTGEVLAMVSEPSFDPNPFVKGISARDYLALKNSPDMPLFNRALRGLYPPASTIKPMVLVAGLDTGATTPTDKVFDPGYYTLPNITHKYRNWNRWGEGWVDMYGAIMRSNDTYFYDLAHKLGVETLTYYLQAFGFGRRVSVDMPEEATGLLPTPQWKRAIRREAWFPGETLILGIGQGYLQVTPLQLAQATSLVASKGIWHRPHLAMLVGGHELMPSSPVADIRLKDPGIWEKITTSMQMAVSDPRGVSRAAAIGAQYSIAGKSGTAQVVAIKQGERYNRNLIHARHRDNALFIGFAPVRHPAIVVAVIIENGEAGARIAGPVVRKVMDAWLLDTDGQLRSRYREPITTEKSLSAPALKAHT
ncbi:penicillin-binding protein 2 [Pseudomonas fluorescens BBc6R8]|uniref:penicillin-binding protein 2 n=1 Tax=Pseudomonas fluorescens TaxID=294 RepID=UPI0003CCBF37|nr:penicillin-binding protein 2 [Pseudomonas fluorescens]QQD55358.1 penicillin-binding protein 2 [Pseudomonas fluorescens BBc6R8]